ncbi:LuxR C-terminal-related transcriptional regulator [Pseudonocardia sp. RS010]|uniref:LuxR C-terminal-related transcriptional regulator n=1 Tax=Pseudonocardia sp. RS010 TaxID=3385979 RepID=UPI0039A090C8
MPEDTTSTAAVDRLVGLRLPQLQRLTGLHTVFGGATSTAPGGPRLRIGHVRGTVGTSLLGLRVDAGRGLGGSVLQSRRPRAVPDYATNPTITHDFDAIVVQQERLTSIVAVPLAVGGSVRGVLYGAVRGPHRVGDGVVEKAAAFAERLEREIEALLPAPPRPRESGRIDTLLDELTAVTRTVGDRAARDRLAHLTEALRAATGRGVPEPAERPGLAPREVEVLQLVAVGMTNGEAAEVLGLSTETVRAYLRSAMRRLDVHNRTAAVHAARRNGLL